MKKELFTPQCGQDQEDGCRLQEEEDHNQTNEHHGQDVELIDTYKYLAVHLNNNLEWKAVSRKWMSRVYFLMKVGDL